jgi:hypothetical protein
MSPEQYLSGLKQLEAATNKSASKMENSFKEYGTSINKAGIAMRYVSSEMGAGAVAFGRAFQVLAGGKIAIAVAAITGAFVALKKAMGSIVVSDKEYNQSLDENIRFGKEQISTLKQRQTEEDGYIERLTELASRENKTNEEQDEAATITKLLSERYGDLGISVNKATGEFADLETAIKKINAAQRGQMLDKMADQIAKLQVKSDALAKKHIGGNLFSDIWEGIGLTSNLAQSNREEYLKKDSAGKLAYALDMVNGGAKTEDSIRFWSEQVDTLTEIIDLEKRMDNLRKAGAETEKEILAQKKASSEESRNAQKAAEAAWESRVAQLDEEAKRQEEIDRKHGEALQKELEKEQQIVAERKKGAEQRRFDDMASLRFDAMKIQGRGREAAVQEAIYNETKAQGQPLDAATIRDITERTNMRYALQNLSVSSPQLYAPRVDSLIARGGSAAPVKMPKVEDLQSKTLSSVDRIQRITDRIMNKIDAWATI